MEARPNAHFWTIGQPIWTIGHSAGSAAPQSLFQMGTNVRSPEEVVAGYHEALSHRDFDAARAMFRDDLRFKGPFDEFATADDYLRAVQGLWGIVDSVEVKHRSSAGDEVVVIYEMATRTPAGTQLVCEWFGVENGTIAWIRALFDTAPFAFLRAEA